MNHQVSGPDELLAEIREALRIGAGSHAIDAILVDCYRRIAANDALAARCGELERDAERYRWLRDPQNADVSGYAASLWGEHMDEAIDSSRALASQAASDK
jgi:hypothetical protein